MNSEDLLAKCVNIMDGVELPGTSRYHDWPWATARIKECIETNRDNVGSFKLACVYQHLAGCQIAMNEIDDARKTYERIHELAPFKMDAIEGHFNLLVENGLVEDAVKLFNSIDLRAIHQEEEDSAIRLLRAVLTLDLETDDRELPLESEKMLDGRFFGLDDCVLGRFLNVARFYVKRSGNKLMVQISKGEVSKRGRSPFGEDSAGR